jgi:hypothetical protein
MQFVTVTVAGTAPRSYAGVGAPPGPADIQAAISNIFQSDGFTAQTVNVKAAETGLVDFAASGGNPYTATITLVIGDTDDPQAAATIIGQEVGKALGQPVSSVSAPTITNSAPDVTPAPASWLDGLAAGFQTDTQFLIVGLIAVAVLVVVILAPELKRSVSA